MGQEKFIHGFFNVRPLRVVDFQLAYGLLNGEYWSVSPLVQISGETRSVIPLVQFSLGQM